MLVKPNCAAMCRQLRPVGREGGGMRERGRGVREREGDEGEGGGMREREGG